MVSSAHYKNKEAVHYRYLWFLAVFGIVFIGFLLIRQIRSSLFLHAPVRISVFFNTNPLTVLSFAQNPEDSTILVTIPELLTTTVPQGYGFYRVGVLWQLAELEKNPRLATETMADFLAVPVSAWVKQGREVTLISDTNEALLRSLKQQFALLSFVMSRQGTNLNFIDRFILISRMKKLDSSNTLTYALHKNEQLFSDQKLADGSTVKVVNASALDAFLEQKFESLTIRQENIVVRVYNATETPRVAQNFARFVTTIGGKVISVESQKNAVPGCLIETTAAHAESKLANFLLFYFSCEKKIVAQIDGTDMKLYIGELFARRWAVGGSL